jgi:Cu(I)/Ag(I) efflux system membrane fusion protein
MIRAWQAVVVVLVTGISCSREQVHAGGDEHAGHQSAPAEHEDHVAPPDGLAPVMLDPARRQQLGVRIAATEPRSFERDLRVSGIVRVDETKQSHVHLKFMGFVEKVFVNFVGRRVKKGEPLLSIYSPDLLAAEAELVQALDAAGRAGASADPQIAALDRRQSDALLEAARARLRLLDVPADEVERLERTRTPSRTLTIRSPLSGTVLERNVVDGMQVMPDMTLLVIADLADVWVLADVFESDLASVRVGDHALLRFAGGAAAEREGRVAFIAPTLDEATRSAKVRIEVANEDGAIRPGLFADVVLHVQGGSGLAVPESAIIVTGTRNLAFVETEPGRFEPREVHAGPRAGGYVQVLHGLREGEKVAVSAQFLLDAESQIRGNAAPGGHGGH